MNKLPDLPHQIMNTLTETIFFGDMDLYNKDTKTFTSELSDHNLKSAPLRIILKTPPRIILKNSNNSIIFTRSHVDYTDSTHEDIAGYWYENDEGYKLLMIND